MSQDWDRKISYFYDPDLKEWDLNPNLRSPSGKRSYPDHDPKIWDTIPKDRAIH